MSIREEYEELEIKLLHPRAAKSRFTRGRARPEEPCSVRTAFQRDRDRIIHSKAFRRLMHKTQVFLAPSGDHYRTRLTHTLEVAQISRTIARALRLNEDLTEAIALGHDLGHTPFGHAGEEALDAVLKEVGFKPGFSHVRQSLRIVDRLEKNGRGLNLTWEVRDGIAHHSKGLEGEILSRQPSTLEGQVVRISDVIAYVNHDLDDSIRAGLLMKIPEKFLRGIGSTHAKRINNLVLNVIEATVREDYTRISINPDMYSLLLELRDFLKEKVYFHPLKAREFEKAKGIVRQLFLFFMEDCEGKRTYCPQYIKEGEEPLAQRIADFISGATDRFALYLYNKFFVPRPWEVF